MISRGAVRTRRCLVEVVAVFSVCFLMNFLGVYSTTQPVPEPQTAEKQIKKTQVADIQKRPSLMGEFMAFNDGKK